MAKTASYAWLKILSDVLENGRIVKPRGRATLELPQQTLQVDMRYPVVCAPERKLSYQFMAAEAFWILTGDNSVAGIAGFNKNIAQFSDDGEVFFGAYGPRIREQINYVVNALIRDKDTRQAGLTIWKENPPESKDIPCTVAIWFMIRDNKLNLHVFMRSSDIWLGVPYDIFNFSMLGHYVCCSLNKKQSGDVIEPGTLFLTAASSHLYDTDWEAARDCLYKMTSQNKTPEILFHDLPVLLFRLSEIRTSKPGDPVRWWECR